MTTTVKPVSATANLPMDAELLHALTLVGQVVTVDYVQYTVHSIEGESWYAYNQDGQISVDTNMTIPEWLRGQAATVHLVPMGCKIGQGFGHTVPLTWVRRGVSLIKGW